MKKNEKRFYKAIPDGFSDWEDVKIIVVTDDKATIFYNNGKLPSILNVTEDYNYEYRHNNITMTRIPEAEAALIL